MYIKMNLVYFKVYFKYSVHRVLFFKKQEYNKYCAEILNAQFIIISKNLHPRPPGG